VPDKDRPAMAVRVVINSEGRKQSHTFHRVMMRSHAKLSYEQAQELIDGHAPSELAPSTSTDLIPSPPPDLILSPSKDAPASTGHASPALRQAQGGTLVKTVLQPLYSAYALLKKEREGRAPLDLELPERKLVLDADGKVLDVILRERLDAHRLIEEFMILANVCAAETLIDARQILLFRIHDEPSLAKMESLRTFLKTLEIDLPKAGALKPAMFNRTLHRVADTEHAPLVNEMVLRSQAQAEYNPENIGHFGLNLRKYAHFTSPIRRYSDLIVHRALIRALDLAQKGTSDGLPDTSLDRMREIGQKISATERRAMMAERDTYDRLVAAHLKDQIGATFTGRISGVTKSGLFVKLTKTGADGYVPAGTLGADFYYHDEAAHALIGQRSGEAFRLGDTVEVRLQEAAPFAGALRFEVLSKGRYIKPTGGKRGARRRGGEDKAFHRTLGRKARGR
jgi:ribonuclease R